MSSTHQAKPMNTPRPEPWSCGCDMTTVTRTRAPPHKHNTAYMCPSVHTLHPLILCMAMQPMASPYSPPARCKDTLLLSIPFSTACSCSVYKTSRAAIAVASSCLTPCCIHTGRPLGLNHLLLNRRPSTYTQKAIDSHMVYMFICTN